MEPDQYAHRFAGLDGLRGVAALMVLAHHLERHLDFKSVILADGFLSVDLFFMLSGFVIAHAYEPKLRGKMILSDYVKARLVRLYPMMALATLVGFLVTFVVPIADGISVPLLAAQLLFIPAVWSPGPIFPYNGAQWSLFFELFVNVVHAIGVRITGGAMTLILAVTTICAMLALLWAAHGWGGSSSDDFLGGFPRAVCGFGLGLLLYRLWSRFPRGHIVIPLPLILAAFVCAILTAGFHRLAWRWYTNDLIVIFVFPPLLWAAACARPGELIARVAAYAGALSYPLYALQGPINRLSVAATSALSIPEFAKVVIWLIAAIGCAAFTLWCFDGPSRRLMAILLGRGGRQLDTPASVP